MNSIKVHNASVTYNQLPVLWDVDMDLPTGRLIGIVGQNGSGKSTLLKAIMGLVPLSSGNVKIFEQDLDTIRTEVAYVPQRESVDWNFPASVQEIVRMGRYQPGRLFQRLTKLDHQLVEDALKKVNMLSFKNRQIGELSGGQQQRVFIARALAQGAKLYLLDEPFVGVDVATEKAIMDLLIEMKKEGKTIVIVHHDLHSVTSLFDYLVMLNTRMIAHGAIDEVLTTENLNATFGGQLNLFAQLQQIIKERDFPIREKGFEEK
ncbi:MAG: metal ABC transporter ATP-binding protein [Bacteroidetes bacterium]|nr:metal ABC transporter ATP-binding protein [Bacteroidota bacterium]